MGPGRDARTSTGPDFDVADEAGASLAAAIAASKDAVLQAVYEEAIADAAAEAYENSCAQARAEEFAGFELEEEGS